MEVLEVWCSGGALQLPICEGMKVWSSGVLEVQSSGGASASVATGGSCAMFALLGWATLCLLRWSTLYCVLLAHVAGCAAPYLQCCGELWCAELCLLIALDCCVLARCAGCTVLIRCPRLCCTVLARCAGLRYAVLTQYPGAAPCSVARSSQPVKGQYNTGVGSSLFGCQHQ